VGPAESRTGGPENPHQTADYKQQPALQKHQSCRGGGSATRGAELPAFG